MHRRDGPPHPRTDPARGHGSPPTTMWHDDCTPPHPAPRPHRRHRPRHRRTRPGLRHGALSPAGCCSPACGNRRETVCPSCSAGLQARRPPARPRGPVRRQRRPRVDHRAPVRVRHPHRPLVRPGPLPADARQDRPALPPPPRREGAPLPARPRHLLPPPPRRGRPPARPAAVRRLLRLRRRRPVQRPRRGPVAPVHHLPAPLPRPPRQASPRRPRRAGRASATSRSPNTRPAASSTSTPSSASTPPATTTGHPPARLHRRPAVPTPSPGRRRRHRHHHRPDPGWPARHAAASAPRPTPGPSATAATCPAPASALSGPSGRLTTSPSTPPKPSTPPACPTGRIRSALDLDGAALPRATTSR